MEEVTEDGITYIQKKESLDEWSCKGCVFLDKYGDCISNYSANTLCSRNATIWIKKEQEMEEYTDKNGIVYIPKADTDEDCIGCAFDGQGTGYDCGKSQAIKSCGISEIIWVKKEQKMSAEVTKDYIEPKYIPKAGIKYDQEKERYDLVPVLALEEVAKVLTAGAHKYNEDYEEENWRKVPNATRRYFSATQRHLAKVRKGETHDTETKLHHYAHAITNLMFLLEKELENKVPTKD